MRTPLAEHAFIALGEGAIDLGMNFLIATGYGGQTLETLALPGDRDPFERITGFPLTSYVTASVAYHFRRR